MPDSLGLMLRSPPCPQGEVGVSKHEAARSFETGARNRVHPPQDEGGVRPSLKVSAVGVPFPTL
jgi:hypothetical protein